MFLKNDGKVIGNFVLLIFHRCIYIYCIFRFVRFIFMKYYILIAFEIEEKLKFKIEVQIRVNNL